jgi:predicted nucleic acid-binding protein
MTPFRIYADTSVIGGVHDPEFTEASRRFVEGVRAGRFILLVSEIVVAELQDAPEAVRRLLPSLPDTFVEPVEIDEEVLALRDAYLEAEIVGPQWTDDAAHVAAATVAKADAIVSWNFTHIVRLDKMKAYNRVNERHDYAPLTIISPTELPGDDDESERS